MSRLFALERYESSDDSRAGATPHLPHLPTSRLTTAQTRLVAAIHLVADDVVLALVEGPDEATVAATAQAAGWRVDRLSPATWITFTTDGE
jgi:hypothetical protein